MIPRNLGQDSETLGEEKQLGLKMGLLVAGDWRKGELLPRSIGIESIRLIKIPGSHETTSYGMT